LKPQNELKDKLISAQMFSVGVNGLETLQIETDKEPKRKVKRIHSAHLYATFSTQRDRLRSTHGCGLFPAASDQKLNRISKTPSPQNVSNIFIFISPKRSSNNKRK